MSCLGADRPTKLYRNLYTAEMAERTLEALN
jgi:hypothetical protein